MKKFVKLVVVIPVGPNSQLDFVLDTIRSVIYYTASDRKIIVIDNSGVNIGKELSADIRELITIQTSENISGIHGALYFWLSSAFLFAYENYNFEVLLKLDTDALIIGKEPEDDALHFFEQNRDVGVIGSYKLDCNPDRRLFQYYTVFHRAFFEQRFPFYNYEYFEFVYALPPEMLFDRRLRRAIILDLMKPLARIPYDKDNLPITDSEVFRIFAKLFEKSKSYINHHIAPIFPEYTTLYADYENALRQELRKWGEDILFDDQIMQRQIFNPDFLHSIWSRHQSGLEPDMIGKIAPIMTYEMMLRKFYDGENVKSV